MCRWSLAAICSLLVASAVMHAHGDEKRAIAANGQSANGQSANGQSASQQKNWVYLENAHLRLGLLRSHGGALGYLSAAGSKLNLLNDYDHGRLVQQSYYGDADGSRWGDRPWRFNPVQGGDYRGAASELVEFRSSKSEAYARTTPRHWATGELLDECVMEQWVELSDALVHVRYRFAYQGDRMHAARHQEVPAVFVAARLKTLVTYAGHRPWQAAPLTRRIPGWPNEYIELAENWAAYVDASGAGVGIYAPGTSQATCYRFEGGAGSDCSYVAPIRTFAIERGLEFTYDVYLTVGDVETIRRRFQDVRDRLP